MNNKYDFSDKDVEKLLNIMHPSISAIEMNLINLIEAMEELGLNVDVVEKIKVMVDNIEFIDQFEEVKAEWKEVAETFYRNVMDVQIKDNLGNPYFTFMQYFQVDELITALDEFIIDSGNRVHLKKEEIVDLTTYKAQLITKAKDIARDVNTLFDQDQMLNVFVKQWKKILEEESLPKTEEDVFDFIIAFEEYNSAGEIENERFWNDKTVRLIYELINRILAIISFVNFLDEFNFEDEEDYE